jgi:hypothetical protein
LRFTQDVQAAQTFAVNVVADHYLVLMDDGEYQLIHESDMELLKDDSSEVAPTQEPPEAALRIVQCALKTRAAVDQGMAALERIRKEPR